MALHSLPGGKTRFATGKPTVLPADRVRFELRKLGLGDWLTSAPATLLTEYDSASRRRATAHLRAMVDGAVSYAERISADEGRIARERFRDVVDCLESMS